LAYLTEVRAHKCLVEHLSVRPPGNTQRRPKNNFDIFRSRRSPERFYAYVFAPQRPPLQPLVCIYSSVCLNGSDEMAVAP
jgi:hypothetical protein